MKATVTTFAIGLTLGFVSLATSMTWAGGGEPNASSPTTASSGNSQRDAEGYLKAARQAIKDKQWDQADRLINQAEKLNVKYDSLLSRFQDTPPKLRKLLDDERAKDTRPSSRFSVFPGGATKDAKSSVPTDPTAGRPPEAVALAREQAVAQMTAEANAPNRVAPAAYLVGDPGTAEPQRTPSLPGTQNIPAALVESANPSAPGGNPAANGPAERINPRGGGQYPTTGAPQNLQLPPGAAAAPINTHPQKPEALRLMTMAQTALDRGDVREAQKLAEQAQGLNVPDAAFGPQETRPWQVLLNVSKAAYRREGVSSAGGAFPNAAPPTGNPVSRGVYVPEQDATQNVKVRADGLISGRMVAPASNAVGATAPPPPAGAVPPTAAALYDAGLRALEIQDRATAIQYFQQAWRVKDQLDPIIQRQLGDKLSQLQAAANPPAKLPPPAADPNERPSPLETVSSQQKINQERLAREIANEHRQAEEQAQADPKGAVANLRKLRDRVAGADVDNVARKQMLTLVDRYIKELDSYIDQNRATIDLAERNERIRSDIDRGRDQKLETQDKLAQLVEQFNKLVDEGRHAEAEVVAKQAKEIAPNEAVTENMVWKAKFIRALVASQSIRDQIENGRVRAGEDQERAMVANVGDENPLAFDTKRWPELTRTRAAALAKEKQRLSPTEMEIQRSLSKPVEVKFKDTPLSEALNTLGAMAGVNVHLDQEGLGSEAITSNTPVTLDLQNPISLRSALQLLLTPKHLSYVVQNEVLLITSEQNRKANVFPKVYYVADLVTPIPNFTPSYNIGIPGALRDSLNALGYGGGLRAGGVAPLSVAGNDPAQPGAANVSPQVMAQMQSTPLPGMGGSRAPSSLAGPGGMGGGVQPDFDSLIQLITQTIQPSSWQEVGGPGSIEPFETNLSLVVSQTQEVHDQIADLLEQLRKLQDLQVTIEVRFITLSDSFFERIGVDFDFNIDDNSGRFPGQNNLLPGQTLQGTPPNVIVPDDTGHSFAVGFNQAGFTPNLDFQFTQGGFGSTTPTFGSFDANSAATFGFAILSDIELFLFLQAAQADDRTNVLQAPKVTLFNGQQAFVSDTSQRPFVTSVVPVVGDFAAAYQPVVVVLSEGTSLSVQAVVSPDRRFCRLTMVPFFSQIGDVETFTFNGRVTTDTGTSAKDPANPDKTVSNNAVRTVEGTTVQLPTFAFTTVATTVSVPDGGTVLLGGIKRLREGRRERGVPLLSKIPYVSRLFRNVGIGRDAQSLLMMVTPRIIIQEEEEDKIGVTELPK